MTNMRKKRDIPLDEVPVICKLHPGFFCNTAKGTFLDKNRQELRDKSGKPAHLGPKRMRLFLLLLREQRSSLGHQGYTEMEDFILAKYGAIPEDPDEYKNAVKAVENDMSFIRLEIQKVHPDKDIIECGGSRNLYRIKPAQLCDQVLPPEM